MRRVVTYETVMDRESRVVLVHGGVDMEPDQATFGIMEEASVSGWAALGQGARAVDAAVRAVAVLEDHPSFNAGFGSVLTREGTVETDGAAFDGRSGRAAGVAAVPGLRNPAALALRLLDEGDAVLLVGPRALDFGTDHGFIAEDLVTEQQRKALAEVKADSGASVFTGRRLPTETVGSVVLDVSGAVSAASSTGGLVGKRPGRVGDAGIPGAGLWADDRFGVLCSGAGEASIRQFLAFQIAQRARDVGVLDGVAGAVTEIAEHGKTVIAVVALDREAGQIVAAHCGSSFPIVVQTENGTERLGVQEVPS